MKAELELPDVKFTRAQCKNFFNELSNREIQILSASMDFTTYKKGQSIYKEGTVPLGLHCINKGKIKISKRGDEGKEQIIQLAKDGDMLGYGPILSGEVYSCSAIALEDSFICYIPKNVFLNVVESNITLSFKMIKLLSHDIRTAEKNITLIAQKPVKERLAETLLNLMELYNTEVESSEINVCLTREEIANIVGTATETTIRLLSEFRKEGVIDLSGKKIKILDVKKLVEISNTAAKNDKTHVFGAG